MTCSALVAADESNGPFDLLMTIPQGKQRQSQLDLTCAKFADLHPTALYHFTKSPVVLERRH